MNGVDDYNVLVNINQSKTVKPSLKGETRMMWAIYRGWYELKDRRYRGQAQTERERVHSHRPALPFTTPAFTLLIVIYIRTSHHTRFSNKLFCKFLLHVYISTFATSILLPRTCVSRGCWKRTAPLCECFLLTAQAATHIQNFE